jgi:hypothetical protein
MICSIARFGLAIILALTAAAVTARVASADIKLENIDGSPNYANINVTGKAGNNGTAYSFGSSLDPNAAGTFTPAPVSGSSSFTNISANSSASETTIVSTSNGLSITSTAQAAEHTTNGTTNNVAHADAHLSVHFSVTTQSESCSLSGSMGGSTNATVFFDLKDLTNSTDVYIQSMPGSFGPPVGPLPTTLAVGDYLIQYDLSISGNTNSSGSVQMNDLSFSAYLPGDINHDGHINAADIVPMMQALTDLHGYEQDHGGLSDAQVTLLGDINGDTKFDNADLQAFLNYLKAGNGSTDSVPEPATFILLALAFPGWALVAARRSRLAVRHTPWSTGAIFRNGHFPASSKHFFPRV